MSWIVCQDASQEIDQVDAACSTSLVVAHDREGEILAIRGDYKS